MNGVMIKSMNRRVTVIIYEIILNKILNQLQSDELIASSNDLTDINTNSHIQTLLLKEGGAKRLSGRHLTSGFHASDRVIDLIIRYGYWNLPISTKNVYNVVFDLNLWKVKATVKTISDLSRLGAKTVRTGLNILRRSNLISKRLNKDSNRIYEYLIKPPNPHNLDFKKALNSVSN